MIPVWSNTNRFSQSGYSSPTVFPQSENYTNKTLWAIDYTESLMREQSHQDWLDEEREEARIEARIQAEETKALREEYHGS